MKIITEQEICALGITPAQCVTWVQDAFTEKPSVTLPSKTWMHFPGDVFINTMPCVIPSLARYGVKVVSRHPGHHPTLQSTILLTNSVTGEPLACLESNWITAQRTGAVATLAAKLFSNEFASASFGFVGLGVMAHATLACLASQFVMPHPIWLLRYKDQAEKMIAEFCDAPNLVFHVANTREELIAHTNTLFSCVTAMNEQFLPPDAYPEGYTLIPVHTRGFQDCDVAFDRIFGDDRTALQDFKHFHEFSYFAELTDVLLGKDPGRRTSHERIISYNIGLALHDVWFATQIYKRLEGHA